MSATLTIDKQMMSFLPATSQEVALGKSFRIDFNRQGEFAQSSKDKVRVRVFADADSSVEIFGRAKLKKGYVNVKVVGFDDDPVDVSSDFKYNIEVEGLGLLDPKVRVIGNTSLARQRWNVFEEFLRVELGISLEDKQVALQELEEYLNSEPDPVEAS